VGAALAAIPDDKVKPPLQRYDKPSSHLLRRGRLSEPGRTYLLTTITHERRPIFTDLQAARALINVLRDRHQLGSVTSLAFVIMPDHLHWLIELQNLQLAKLMQTIKGHSARAINTIHGTSGERIWQVGYHDHTLRDDEEVKSVVRYIVANPLRAGLVERIEEYPFWDAIWF
jgi:REP element-mobilizing transposase RayT